MPTDPNDVRTNDLEKWLYPATGAMHEWRGSYLGFTYNGRHSSEFGIVRTSTSNRYDDNLLPNKNVKTTAVPGGDGAYYFGSNYTQRQFTVQFAFDALSDAQLREMRQWLGTGQIHDLIFDEFPYKVYSAAVTGNATAKHLCFDEGNGVVYKGDGSIQFTCYFPFARSRYKWLSDYTIANIPEWNNDEFYNNKTEWAVGSGMLESSVITEDTLYYDSYKGETGRDYIGYIPVLNVGDVPTDFQLFIPSQFLTNNLTIWYGALASHSDYKITIGALSNPPERGGIVMNSKTRLLQDCVINVGGNFVIGNTLYNQYIINGDFFKILTTSSDSLTCIGFQTTSSVGNDSPIIKYNYLYY